MARRRYHAPPPRSRDPRINHQIHADQLRVVVDGKGAELMPRAKALELAQSMGLDLVEVSPGQNPPVCKIIDFGKYKYELQKKKKDQSRNQHTIQVKEIKMRPKIGDHDYEIKKNRALEFLEKGNKVKVSLRFRGREMAHPELGMKLMHRLAADVKEAATVETPAKMEGRQIIMVMASRGKKKSDKPEDENSEPSSKNEVDGKAPRGDEVSSKSQT